MGRVLNWSLRGFLGVKNPSREEGEAVGSKWEAEARRWGEQGMTGNSQLSVEEPLETGRIFSDL